MTPAEFLALTRTHAAATAASARTYRAVSDGSAESFLTLHTKAGKFESASYAQLGFISGDDRGGTSIRLLLGKMAVTLRGLQLGAVFESIRTKKAAHLYEFDGGRYDPPEPGQPVITDIAFALEQPRAEQARPQAQQATGESPPPRQ